MPGDLFSVMDGFVSNRPLMRAQIACFHVDIYAVRWLLLSTSLQMRFFPPVSIKIFVLVSVKAAFNDRACWRSSQPADRMNVDVDSLF